MNVIRHIGKTERNLNTRISEDKRIFNGGSGHIAIANHLISEKHCFIELFLLKYKIIEYLLDVTTRKKWANNNNNYNKNTFFIFTFLCLTARIRATLNLDIFTRLSTRFRPFFGASSDPFN